MAVSFEIENRKELNIIDCVILLLCLLCVCVLKAGLIYFCWTVLEKRICDFMVNVGIRDCRFSFLLSGVMLLV